MKRITPAEKAASAKLLELLSDRWWRISNLYWVQDETGQAVKFVPNDAQRQLWDDLHYNNVILKARQLGFSTFVAIFILDTCLFRENTAAGIVDITLDDARKKLDKIKFAYDRLPDEIRKARPIKRDNAHEIEWKNGSNVIVGVSLRGGTYQILHVSEYGKISAKTPDKSREIKTGAFGTIHAGSMIIVESTAEGAAGDYHDMVKEAQKQEQLGRKLSPQMFKLHFFPWHRNPKYVDDPASVLIDQEMAAYFADIAAKHNVNLSPEQKAWYIARRKLVGPDDMFREYPSYADEAFYASVQGAYFAQQLTKLREQRRIGAVPHDPSRQTMTAWDIGKDDNTSVWFFQAHGRVIHMIDYYENSGEGVDHYAKMLTARAVERGYLYGTHYGPHDLDSTHWTMPGAEATVDVARRLGINFRVVPRIPDKQMAIEAARNWLPMCWFDETNCARGLTCLENYRKEWDERRATFRSDPLHDWASHGADAFMTGACGFTPEAIPDTRDRYSKRKNSGSAWAA